MKTLYLMRHAKSSWEDPDLHDHERPLLEKGESRTEKIIKFLKNRKTKPGIIVSSHTVRAKETAKLVANGLKYKESEILIDSKLYFDSADGITEVVYSLPNEKESAIIIGHNPYLTDFANHFVSRKIESIPTSGVICIDFFTNNWEEISLADKKIKFIIYPNDL